MRTITAGVLIASSFLSAYVLSSMANTTQLLWSAKVPLIPGAQISANDLVAKKVAIPDGVNAYISVSRDVAHFYVLRSIEPGELLPASALSGDAKTLHMSAVPISVHSADIPADLMTGEAINLYHVGDARLAKEIGPPNLVLSHVYILGVDRKGQNLGGDLALTISVNTRNIMQVLDATASGRIVVVRVNG